jgi:hypothetical protein
LPDGDADYALRWRLIKSVFSRALPNDERISASRAHKGERAIWQRRYWEHTLRNEGLRTPSRLHSFQPGQTWPRWPRSGLAVLDISPHGA